MSVGIKRTQLASEAYVNDVWKRPLCASWSNTCYEQWEDEAGIHMLGLMEISYKWIVTFLEKAHRPLLAMSKPLTTVLLRR